MFILNISKHYSRTLIYLLLDELEELLEELLEVEEFELIIQVNGKVRGKTIIEKNRPQDEIENIASQLENVKDHIGNNEIKKSIYVKDKLINFVI